MPEYTEAPQIQDVDLEQEKLILALQELRDSVALSLVKKTFWQYDNFRQTNHDSRWNTNDALYLGYVPQKMWEGTTTPRSSLPYSIVFDQIEAAMPAVMQAIFGSQPDWFQVESDEGGDQLEARAIQAHLLYLLDHDKDEFGLTARTDIETAIKSLFLYGNGGVAIEWDAEKNRPSVSWVDNRDIYFDPATPIPSVDFCRSVIRRSQATVEEIIGWRNVKGMKIPSDEVIYGMAMSTQTAAGDRTKQNQSALMGVSQNNVHNQLPNPADRFVEVLTYYTRSRIIVVLNREWIAFNDKNIYDFIPFAFAPCYTVPGKFYSLALPDVQEGNQRTIEALLNSRLDEINLTLHPPRAQKSSSLLTPNQQKWRPGAVFRMQNPKEDMVPFITSGATTNVYEEIDFVERMAEKRTGINALSQSVPRPSNANRTASGMQMQLQGSANRLQTIVQHIENYMLVPMLYKMQKMIRLHAPPTAQLPGRTPEGQMMQVDASLFKKEVNFKILASSQMVTRDKLAGVVPIFVQYLASGPLISGLQQSGFTVDWNELFTMMQDATGVGRLYKLIRPMNEQEKQAASQPPPDVAAETQQVQMQEQTKMQIAQMNNQTVLQKEQMSAQKSPMEMQAEQQKLELEMMKEQMKLQIEQQKMELEKQKAEMQIQLKRIEMDMKAQELQMKQVFGQAEMEQDFALKQQQGQLDADLAQQQHQMALQQTQEQGTLKSQQTQEQHKQKMAITKESGKVKREDLKATSQVKQRLNERGRPVRPRATTRDTAK